MATEGELIVRFRSFCLAGAGREAREGELLVLATEGGLLLYPKGKEGELNENEFHLVHFSNPLLRELNELNFSFS